MPRRQSSRYLMAYDVTCDEKRTKLANMLLDYGARVQKSVFEADLTRAEVQEILMKAANYIASEDSFRLYPLCKSCVTGMQSLGRKSDASALVELRII